MIKNWSMVKTPIGVSLKHIENKKPSDIEVCVATIDGVLHISIHQDGIDLPLVEIQHNTNR
jgi:hypothetical protein